MTQSYSCPICQGTAYLFDVVDFNKSCEEARGKFLKLSGTPIYYVLCKECAHLFCPEIANWPIQTFADRIYNDQYLEVDPDYPDTRPRGNAANLAAIFSAENLATANTNLASIRHLDYGGGNGLLAKLLTEAGFDSTSYDPFVDKELDLNCLGQFKLITAFEVFEHVPDLTKLMTDLRALLTTDGILLFTTLLSDGNIQTGQRLSWWYASPRNGHISLFSSQSLNLLAQQYGFNLGSFSTGFHIMYTQPPSWAQHLF